MNSAMDNQLMLAGFSHSDISGSKVVCHLPEAFRRLPRLSSPLTAKASAVCAYSLDHITPKNLFGCPTNLQDRQGTNLIRRKFALELANLPQLINYQ